jgi:AcrR family transcriptional regulator
LPESTTTRDRIIDEAMRLFSQQGYASTSIAKIEAAAGLTPGAGGLYHHFHSKEDLLAAGVERHLARLDALRDIQRALAPLGDLQAELTLTARYILTELDSESELLRILVAEARNRPQMLARAVDRLVNSTLDGFAAWVEERMEGTKHAGNARAIAAVGLGSLLSSRLLHDVLGVRTQVDDAALVDTWVALMLAALTSR